jgi:MFS family permease
MGYTRVLRRNGSFRLLLLGQCVSEIGDWFQLIALLSMLPTTGHAVQGVAMLFIVRWLPSVLFTPIAGVLADRFPRARVMIAADLLRALVVLGYLGVRGPEDLPFVYALSFAQEALTTCFEPARGAAIPQVVPPDDLFAANALGGAVWSSMLAIGAMLGGIVVATLGNQAAFLLNGATFVVSALFVAAARIPPHARPTTRSTTLADDLGWTAFREGARYLAENPAQRAIVSIKLGLGVIGAMTVLLSVFAEQVYSGASASLTLGWLYGARGLGAFVGPFVSHRVLGGYLLALSRGVALAFPGAALAYALFAVAPSFPLALVAFVFATSFTSTVWVNSTQLLQITVPNALLGRVLAVELALLTLGLSVASALVSTLLARDITTPRGAALCVAAAMLLPTLRWAFGHARLKRAVRDAELQSEAHVAPESAPPG